MTRGMAPCLMEMFVDKTDYLSIPRALIRFFGDDIEVSLFFSRLIFWYDSTGSNIIAKSYREWQDDICLKIHRIRNIVRKLTEIGLVKSELKILSEKPSLEITIHADQFAIKFAQFLGIDTKILDLKILDQQTKINYKDPKDLQVLEKPKSTRKQPVVQQTKIKTKGSLYPTDSPKEGKPTGAEYRPIIDALNKAAGTNYRVAAYSKRWIDKRWRDGFRLPDFEKVIANMAARWKGTEWEMYLRPETLFGNKFESYLNAPKGGGNGPYKRGDGRDKEPNGGKYAGLEEIIEI